MSRILNCPICNTTFTAKDNRRKYCSVPCRETNEKNNKNIRTREWYAKRRQTNPEKHKECLKAASEQFKERMRDPDKWAKRKKTRDEWLIAEPRNRLLYNARHRAKRSGLECNITLDDIKIPANNICPILGIEMTCVTGNRAPSINSLSLDRVDNSKGYTKDNIRVISHKANTLKNAASLTILKKIVEYVEANLPKETSDA